MRQAAAQLAEDFGVAEATAGLLVSNGYVTLDGIKAADADVLLAIPGIDRDEVAQALERLNG